MKTPGILLVSMLLILVASKSLPAQKLLINMKDGTENQEYFAAVEKLSFDASALQVVQTSGSIIPYELSEIRKIYFFKTTGIPGITGTSDNKLFISPNPATTSIKVSGIPYGTTKVEIYNLIGTRLSTIKVEENSVILDIVSLKPGLYLLKASNLTAKFIKQ